MLCICGCRMHAVHACAGRINRPIEERSLNSVSAKSAIVIVEDSRFSLDTVCGAGHASSELYYTCASWLLLQTQSLRGAAVMVCIAGYIATWYRPSSIVPSFLLLVLLVHLGIDFCKELVEVLPVSRGLHYNSPCPLAQTAIRR